MALLLAKLGSHSRPSFGGVEHEAICVLAKSTKSNGALRCVRQALLACSVAPVTQMNLVPVLSIINMEQKVERGRNKASLLTLRRPSNWSSGQSGLLVVLLLA
jgi:hypothetical protein